MEKLEKKQGSIIAILAMAIVIHSDLKDILRTKDDFYK